VGHTRVTDQSIFVRFRMAGTLLLCKILGDLLVPYVGFDKSFQVMLLKSKT